MGSFRRSLRVDAQSLGKHLLRGHAQTLSDTLNGSVRRAVASIVPIRLMAQNPTNGAAADSRVALKLGVRHATLLLEGIEVLRKDHSI